MYEIMVEEGFSAAHRLDGYPGNCSRIHGHNWKVRVFINAEALDDMGFVLDFRNVKSAITQVLKPLDHSFLNDHPQFAKVAPSSENLASFLFHELKERLQDSRCRLKAVQVEENHGVAASYAE